LRKSG